MPLTVKLPVTFNELAVAAPIVVILVDPAQVDRAVFSTLPKPISLFVSVTAPVSVLTLVTPPVTVITPVLLL